MAALGERTGLFENENRAIGVALLVSIALHAALLFLLPTLRDAQQRRNDMRDPILARLTQPQVQSAANPVLPQAPPQTRKPVFASSVPKPQPRVRATPELVPTAPEQPRSVEPALASAETAPSMQVVTVAQPALAPSAQAAERADAGTLAQYRLALIGAARLYKRYPRVALDNNWQGKVEVRIAIGAGGAISMLSVRTSTGHHVLDQQALEMIEMAKAMAQIPPALRGREFAVDIPVIFSLREPDA
ncbi:MAG: TonB family protein [Burkholderiales bacterium]